MNTPDSIEAAFTAWAQANDDIRAAFVVGSRARIDHPADEWADLDIIMFARNVERYRDTTDWIEALAPLWIAIAGRTVAGDPERLVLFEGGVQVDFVFHSSEVLQGVPQMLASGSIPETVLRGTRGSLLLSIAMHASISSSALIFGQQYSTLGKEITWTALSVGLALVAALLIWLGVRRQDVRRD